MYRTYLTDLINPCNACKYMYCFLENHRQMEQEIYVVIFQRMSTVKLSLKNPYH